MNILITGGTGFIGKELREELLKEGHSLIIVTRSPKKYEDEAASNQKFVSLDDDNIVSIMESCTAVINLAGENIFGQRWNEEVKQRIYDSRIVRPLVHWLRPWLLQRPSQKCLSRPQHQESTVIEAIPF